jgi:ferredoxin
MTKQIRKIVKIDEEKCNGCGNCIIACAEGALRIIDGKAQLINETYCDGLGACLGECPQGAIVVEERLAEDFSEVEIEKHLNKTKPERFECQGTAVQELVRSESSERGSEGSHLSHWPVQLALVPPSAPFLRNADILLTADCVPFAYTGFHWDFIKGHAVLVACPKLGDFAAYLEKLIQILQVARPKSLTIVHMEVPCCSGLVFMAKQAMKETGMLIPFNEVTISVKGEVDTHGQARGTL